MKTKPALTIIAVLLSLTTASCGVQIVQTSTPSPVPTATSTPPPTSTPTPTPTSTPSPDLVEITVYFTDSDRFAAATPPYEVAVTRHVDPSADEPEAVIHAFFAGPTHDERQQGLELFASGFTGFSSLTIENGIARITLTGTCTSHGGVYTVAQPIMRNLLQFPDVEYVKIYDEHGNTEIPDGRSNSIPACLEP